MVQHPHSDDNFFPYQLLFDDLQDTVLLQQLTRHVQRQVVAVNNSLDEVQVPGQQVLEVVCDEHTAHVPVVKVWCVGLSCSCAGTYRRTFDTGALGSNWCCSCAAGMNRIDLNSTCAEGKRVWERVWVV